MAGPRSRRCIGRCGRYVVRSRFSCPRCLDRLPDRIRRPIEATAGKPDSQGKREAWAAGREWIEQRRRPGHVGSF